MINHASCQLIWQWRAFGRWANVANLIDPIKSHVRQSQSEHDDKYTHT